MIPVRETGDDVLVEVGQHALEGLRHARRFAPERASHIAGRDGGKYRVLLDAAAVIGRPFGGALERRPQRFRAPVGCRGTLHRRRRSGIGPVGLVRHELS